MLAVLAALAFLRPVSAQSLSASDIAVVTQNLATGAQHSWELGTRAQALLNLNVPNFSVFTTTGLPPPTSVPSNTTSAIAPVFSIAHNVVTKLNASSGPTPLIVGDGAAGDPPSIGVAVLLANWTGQGSDGTDYAKAALNQLDYTLNVVPRTPDGAISHRAAQVQLWSDSVYMVPPFLAYYGLLTGNTTLMDEAYNQIKLYRNYLRDSHANNLWQHIVLGTSGQDTGNDFGHWSTGNGWAAAGMLRVLATMKNSPFSKSFSSQQRDLGNWVKEIHSAMFAHIDNTNIFTNYADQPISTSGMFYDAASTALIASTVYRAALLINDHSHLPNAEKCRQALFAAPSNSSSNLALVGRAPGDNSTSSASHNSASASASQSHVSSSSSASATAPATSPSATTAPIKQLAHFSNDGWLQPVVNPNQFGVQGSNSPEGQAFVLELQASYNEWVAAGSPGANAARRTAATAGWASVVGCIGLGSLLLFV
ncbi:Six-hairpin glycosidase-like protein [Favolaschia claudopus]|uniref:Six-hairpin glycosidase-like protein n=1 Tax=Favolaschia claudopus TaxID=2862362 RepID=A0AAW0ANL0_9AGAR